MTDFSTEILIQIRDEIRATNGRVDGTNNRLDAVIERQTASDVRTATELVAVRETVQTLVDLLRTDRTLRGDVADLKERVTVLERKTA